MSTAKFDTLSNLAGTQTVPVATVAQGSAKAWVNFNGSGTVAIRAAFNVSSITDNGTGDYTINFTTAMPDADYSVSGLAKETGDNTINSSTLMMPLQYATTSVRLGTLQSGTGPRDCVFNGAAIFR